MWEPVRAGAVRPGAVRRAVAVQVTRSGHHHLTVLVVDDDLVGVRIRRASAVPAAADRDLRRGRHAVSEVHADRRDATAAGLDEDTLPAVDAVGVELRLTARDARIGADRRDVRGRQDDEGEDVRVGDELLRLLTDEEFTGTW